MELISSGLGGIFFYSDTDIRFRPDKLGNRPEFSTKVPKNQTFPLNGTYPKGQEKSGEHPIELNNKYPSIPEKVLSNVKDSKHGANRLTITEPTWPKYRESAKSTGCYLDGPSTQYPLPPGFSPRQGVSGNDKVKVLDFGNQISPNNSTDPWINPPKGVVYSPYSLVIKGNPPKDLIIVSDQTIYIAGDFNQKGDPNKGTDKYGFPQNYGDPAGVDPKTVDNYSKDLEQRLLDDAEASTVNKVHQTVTVIARERTVYDYRSPIDCFENELYPYLKFQLASTIATPNSAYNSFMKVGGAGMVACSAANRSDLKNNLKTFFSKYPLGDAQKELDLSEEFALAYDQSPSFNDSTLDPLSKKVWNTYKQQYSSKNLDPNFGVYKILIDLKTESQTNCKKDDYLYFPEMTTNGMFVSGAMRNQKFFTGPDEAIWYDEIGNLDGIGVGRSHSGDQGFIHRMYGSEVRLSRTPVGEISLNAYMPPLRRKIYDYSLPRSKLSQDLSTFVILTWKDTRATKADFDSF
ncbi:hypothetical protein HYY75_06335 [bacterium]|nr:hypothetical protein [bacterium]